jgi:hypothetical protein
LLEDLEEGGEGGVGGFVGEEMDVFGHEDVTVEEELVALPESFQCLLEDDAGLVVVQVWGSVVTTEGDEVVVALGLVTLRAARGEVIVTSNT